MINLILSLAIDVFGVIVLVLMLAWMQQIHDCLKINADKLTELFDEINRLKSEIDSLKKQI
jgi:uncharacterized membrane protein